MEWALALVALALLGVAAVSRRLSGTPITPAMLFVAFGLLVGPEVLDGIDLSSTGSTVRALAEATLALVLFSDASRIDLGTLRRTVGVPVRLLGIGLPLTIALGAVAAAAVFGELSVEEAVILGVVLAPTDAALGQAVVTEPRVPARIRQGLNVESGLNDGICVPLLFAAVAVADVESEISGGRSAGTLLLEEIGYGVLGGVVAGLADRRDRHPRRPARPDRGAVAAGDPGRRRRARLRHRRSRSTARASSRRSSRASCSASRSGATPRSSTGSPRRSASVLNGVTFVLFGAILLGPALSELSWQLALYAVLSLTVVRMLPVAIAMLGSRARAADARLPRLVRPARAGVDRLRGDRGRGVPPPARAPDRAGDLPHRRALGPRPRPDRGAARRPLRALVRAPPRATAPADGERPTPRSPARAERWPPPRPVAARKRRRPGTCDRDRRGTRVDGVAPLEPRGRGRVPRAVGVGLQCFRLGRT